MNVIALAAAAGPLHGECALCGNEGPLWHWACERCEQAQQDNDDNEKEGENG